MAVEACVQNPCCHDVVAMLFFWASELSNWEMALHKEGPAEV